MENDNLLDVVIQTGIINLTMAGTYLEMVELISSIVGLLILVRSRNVLNL